jgi:hypothetical protein
MNWPDTEPSPIWDKHEADSGDIHVHVCSEWDYRFQAHTCFKSHVHCDLHQIICFLRGSSWLDKAYYYFLWEKVTSVTLCPSHTGPSHLPNIWQFIQNIQGLFLLLCLILLSFKSEHRSGDEDLCHFKTLIVVQGVTNSATLVVATNSQFRISR